MSGSPLPENVKGSPKYLESVARLHHTFIVQTAVSYATAVLRPGFKLTSLSSPDAPELHLDAQGSLMTHSAGVESYDAGAHPPTHPLHGLASAESTKAETLRCQPSFVTCKPVAS